MTYQQVKALLESLSIMVLGVPFTILLHFDKKYSSVHPVDHIEGRLYLQLQYNAPHTKTGEPGTWKGQKWYLSSHMTEDEVVKTAFKAVQQATQHEIMEGFKFDGKIVFNPHASFRDLMAINQEVTREPAP